MSSDGHTMTDTPLVLEHILAGGEMVSAQLPSVSTWSPEKRLAGAVLMSALVEIRDHHGEPSHRRKVHQDLQWIASDDVEWPFSFVCLCQVFDLEPDWVREVVAHWTKTPARRPRQSVYVNAA